MAHGVYIHLPFCSVHCTYCPFAISTDIALQDAYVEALVREISAAGSGRPARPRRTSRPALTAARDAPRKAGRTPAPLLESIYLGGGTPSRTSLENLARVLEALRATFDIAERAEISIEANPEDVTEASIAGWRELGVNRISIGVQSFLDAELQAIGRIHDRAAAIEAVRIVSQSGVRANLDLILGLPQQTRHSFRETLDTAVALGAGHLSLYMLDLEEKTPLQVQVARGRVALPEDDDVAELYLDTVERLGRAGLAQYEISNFARPGEECLHNLRYWTRGEYFGFGLGAHSFRGDERFANTRDIRRYIDSSPHARDFSETLGGDEARRETLFLSLRRTSGINYADLVELCGQEGVEWSERGLSEGWLKRLHGSNAGRVAFTPAGFLQSNEFISRLF